MNSGFEVSPASKDLDKHQVLINRVGPAACSPCLPGYEKSLSPPMVMEGILNLVGPTQFSSGVYTDPVKNGFLRKELLNNRCMADI